MRSDTFFFSCVLFHSFFIPGVLLYLIRSGGSRALICLSPERHDISYFFQCSFFFFFWKLRHLLCHALVVCSDLHFALHLPVCVQPALKAGSGREDIPVLNGGVVFCFHLIVQSLRRSKLLQALSLQTGVSWSSCRRSFQVLCSIFWWWRRLFVISLFSSFEVRVS